MWVVGSKIVIGLYIWTRGHMWVVGSKIVIGLYILVVSVVCSVLCVPYVGGGV